MHSFVFAAVGFLPLGRFVAPATHVSFHDANNINNLARTAVLNMQRSPRSPSPKAFDDGGLNLSNEELAALARARGIVVPDDATRLELSSLLDMPPSPTSPPSFFTPAEAARVQAFERVAPSVAHIQVSIKANNPFALKPFEVPAGSGSGFVWDAHGHIVTNYHVVAGGALGRGPRPGRSGNEQMPRKVKVKLQGGEEIEAKVVGTEPDKDIAVLKVDPAALGSSLKPLEAASSAELKVGQSVLAIGNPFGLDWTLTQGIVSAVGRDIDGAGGRPIRDCIQTDASINPGNSGGPLLDSAGKLIGVNTMIYSPSGGNVGIGFAVPVDTVKRVVKQIIERGPNARPSLGISVLPDQIRSQYGKNLKRKLDGAIIAEVVPGSPADGLKLAACERRGAGVLLGDMIISVNGQDISSNEDLLCAIEESEPDVPLSLTVMKACDPERVEEVEVTPVPRKQLDAGR